MENIRDWNISRQLFWGQQIPAYYYGDGKDDFVVASTVVEALKLAQKKSNNSSLSVNDLRQDADVLDTWFSSWLWPISVFDGIRNPDNAEFNYYYPTNDLVTGPDILFFWVARMIVAGFEFKEEKPFENVYLTGLVRDKQRRKMSKSLGNSPDALGLIEQFGADGVRVGLLLSSAAGNDLLFDEALCQQGKGFGNKIWNAFRLINGWEVADIEQPEYASIALDWYTSKFQKVLAEIEDHFKENNIRLNAIGDIKTLPTKVYNELIHVADATKSNTKMTLNLALNYGSRDELTQMVRKIGEKIKNNIISSEKIDESVINQHLYTRNLPDVDLLIRTSGEQRLSNFLLWQIAYAELYFTEVFWPDFSDEDLYKAIASYQKRERRFGKTSEQLN